MDRRSSLQGPSIEFTRIPQADPAGSARNDIIEGRVTGASPGEKIVLYAKTGKWWVQPLIDQPITDLRPNFKWTNSTHLGTHYAALLVKDGYRPQRVLNSLPKTDDDILAVAVVPGAKRPPSPVINFSGYQWRLRDAPRRPKRPLAIKYLSRRTWRNALAHLQDGKGHSHWRTSRRRRQAPASPVVERRIGTCRIQDFASGWLPRNSRSRAAEYDSSSRIAEKN